MNEAHETEDVSVNPREIALTFDRVISAHWRGETEAASTCGAWFEAHWSEQAPPEPDDPPEGTSILGASGSGIRWYARDEAVLGFVSRRPNGCYRVQVSEALPTLDAAPNPAARRADADHLLHTAGAGPFVAQAASGERGLASGETRGHGGPRRPRQTITDERDRRLLVRPVPAERRAGDSDGVAAQAPVFTEVLVAVHVREPAPAAEPPAVPAGS